jgi:hypothetical protein
MKLKAQALSPLDMKNRHMRKKAVINLGWIAGIILTDIFLSFFFEGDRMGTCE